MTRVLTVCFIILKSAICAAQTDSVNYGRIYKLSSC